MAFQNLTSAAVQKRCAIYTRKSTTAGLELDYNSLDTQREVCSAYIKCQSHRQWTELPQTYDDGGFSGGSLERPALRRLLGDVEAGRIDLVVVYKIDRLSRSLGDFIRLIDTLDRYGASFVSVTQTFDTTDSMGRLVLNILLTFAQFERELASDRTRDKKAALMRRGLFVGGTPPFGYTLAKGGRLIVDQERAGLVTEMFDRFPEVPANQLSREFRARGLATAQYITRRGVRRGGHPITTNQVLNILRNSIYVGFIVHRGDWIKADIEALTSKDQWDLVQEVSRTRFAPATDPIRNNLMGILHDEQGRRMRIQRGTGRSRELRYYKSEYTTWSRDGVTRRVMVSADHTEQLAVSALQAFLRDRVQLKAAVLSLGLYSDEIAQLLRRGNLAAKRVGQMEGSALRALLKAVIPRAEASPTGLKLLVSCHEISRLLSWDGVGTFEASSTRPIRVADRIYEVHAPAFLIAGHPRFMLPISPRASESSAPTPWLVDLLSRATELRAFALANRTKSVAELARAKGLGPSTFARYLRVNYLAPDIQAAIMDGTQPESMTVGALLYGPMPLDWGQQRLVLGFES
jgi:site-specific DNA recombinase